MDDLKFSEFLDTFGGRALIAAAFNYFVILVFTAFLPIAKYTVDQGIVYSCLISIPLFFILEFVIAKKHGRRPHIAQLVGGSILGILGIAIIIIPMLLLVHAF